MGQEPLNVAGGLWQPIGHREVADAATAPADERAERDRDIDAALAYIRQHYRPVAPVRAPHIVTDP